MDTATKKKVSKKTAKKTATKKKVVAKKNDFIPVVITDDETDPRHKLFEAYYTNPESPTFSNALRSALKAGYSRNYSENILVAKPAWLEDIVGRMVASKMALKSRQNLEEDLNMNIVEQAIGPYGPIFSKDENGEKTIPVMARNIKAVEARQKATFFVAERVDPLFNKVNKKDGDTVFQVAINQIIINNPHGSGDLQNIDA